MRNDVADAISDSAAALNFNQPTITKVACCAVKKYGKGACLTVDINNRDDNGTPKMNFVKEIRILTDTFIYPLLKEQTIALSTLS